MYPLKFQPVFQKRLWGGQRLRTHLGKAVQGGGWGESWELADLPAGTVGPDSRGAAADGSLSSVVANGALAGKTLHDLMTKSEIRILNSELLAGYFPLLIKFLDAQQDLSVQVHPDAAYSAAHPEAHVKSEAWYVIHAEPGARIYKGVKAGVTREQFRAALQARDVEPLLNAVAARPGDCHYLPSGTLHALGAGILVAEVQTPSDTTFRVFDWNRLGSDGKPRMLHVEEALACIQFAAPPAAGEIMTVPEGQRLVNCEHFTLDRMQVAQGTERPITSDAMTVWIIIEGQGVIRAAGSPPTALARGDTVLLPPGMGGASLKTVTDCVWLEARPASASGRGR